MRNIKYTRKNHLLKFIYKIIDIVIILSFSVILLATFYNILLRNIFSSGYLWLDEIITLSMVIAVMFGVALGIKEKTHVALDGIVAKMPRKIQRVFYFVDNIIVLIFFIFTIYGGFRYVSIAKGQAMMVLKWPVSILYIFIPIGIIFATIEHIINCIIDIKTDNCRFIPIEEQVASNNDD